MFEIEIDSRFDASHALRLTDGSMEPVHGHDWGVTVTVSGGDRLDGMDCVMDFHQLEGLVAAVIAPWRGRLLNEVSPFAGSINPSAERVAEQVAQAVADRLPDGVRLARVTVTEAPGCRAAWLANPDSGGK